jgi:hypothetical protein
MNEYMDIANKIDNQKQYNGGYKIIGYCGIEWYCAIPPTDETVKLTSAIMHYIESYK